MKDQAPCQPSAALSEPAIELQAQFPTIILFTAVHPAHPRPMIFPLFVSLSPSTLFALKTTS